MHENPNFVQKNNLLLDILDDYDYLTCRREILGEELLAQCNLLKKLLSEE